MKRIAYTLAFFVGLLLAACGGDGSTAPTCTGASCVCDPGATCEFSSSTCGGDAGSCTLSCANDNTCTGSCEESCSVDCSGGSTCSPTVGPSGSVSCTDGSVCHVTCTGSCSVSCSVDSTCDLRCAGDAAPMTISGSASCG